jgi:hypothetical protein
MNYDTDKVPPRRGNRKRSRLVLCAVRPVGYKLGVYNHATQAWEYQDFKYDDTIPLGWIDIPLFDFGAEL